MGATIFTANTDNAVSSPTLWQHSEMLFHASLNGPGIIVGEKHMC